MQYAGYIFFAQGRIVTCRAVQERVPVRRGKPGNVSRPLWDWTAPISLKSSLCVLSRVRLESKQ